MTTLPESPEALIDENETARRLAWSVKTLRRRRWSGLPPRFVKIGRSVRYEPAEVEAFINAGKRRSTSDTSHDPA